MYLFYLIQSLQFLVSFIDDQEIAASVDHSFLFFSPITWLKLMIILIFLFLFIVTILLSIYNYRNILLLH